MPVLRTGRTNKYCIIESTVAHGKWSRPAIAKQASVPTQFPHKWLGGNCRRATHRLAVIRTKSRREQTEHKYTHAQNTLPLTSISVAYMRPPPHAQFACKRIGHEKQGEQPINSRNYSILHFMGDLRCRGDCVAYIPKIMQH